MSEWKRRTKEVPLESLPSEIASAVHQHIDGHNLGPILSDALMCIQTDSEKTKKGLFASAQSVQLFAIITPLWLVWCIEEPKAKPTVLSAQLIQVTVQNYAQTPLAKLVPDSGIEVSGMFTGSSEGASAFIGLDEGAAGHKFRTTVIKAAADAKK